MAQFNASSSDRVLKIGKFLGVNECPDGDTNLKIGEASNMQNFKITDDGSLQKRGGTKNVAGLLSAYTIEAASTTTTVATETNTSTNTYTAYPTISVSAGSVLTLSGTSVNVTYANIATYAGYYWQDSTTGLIYQLGTCEYTEATGGTHVTGGAVSISATETYFRYAWTYTNYTTYSAVSVLSGTVVESGTSTSARPELGNWVGRYMAYNGVVYQISRVGARDGYDTNAIYGYPVSFVGNDTYTWKFYAVTATTTSTDIEVKALWSGYVGGTEYIVAACNGKLWSLTESSGVWTKTDIGTISTASHVHLFGFDSKLYVIDGSQYRSWNGTTLSVVTGYRPLIMTATAPAGGGTALEGINKLNGLRRVWFSSTGDTTFQLPETSLASVDYVKYVSSGTAIAYTADTSTGLVTASASTTSGTNNIEVGYTVSTTYRSTVVAMKFSETYNGETDTRIFLYGDGSNKAFYSGLEYSGAPTAEYFPDLNEIKVDASNTPITSLIKHYDSLLAYKSNGAFIINYGNVTDSAGNTIAAFYVSPLNREIGNEAAGQVRLIKNNPYTLFGRSAYEWKLSSYASKDERNAIPVSDRVSQTLSAMDFSKAICFDDVFHTEYYIVENSTAVVYNYSNDTWYVYKQFPAVCMITYKQELYFGTADGFIRHYSRDYMNDIGAVIECYWESGSIDFGAAFKRKYSRGLWIGIKPENNGLISVTAITDATSNLNEEESASDNTETSATGFFDFLNLSFETLSFNISSMPRPDAIKIKAKKFTYYKLIFSSSTDNTTATVTDAEIAYRYTSNVR